MKEKVYVTYTCKNPKCRIAFIDLDPNNNIDDVPLKNRYCPECVKNGLKNSNLKKMSKQEIEAKDILSFINDNIKSLGMEDKKDIKFIKKYFLNKLKTKKNNGERVNKVTLFKETMEVLSYQNWKLDKNI